MPENIRKHLIVITGLHIQAVLVGIFAAFLFCFVLFCFYISKQICCIFNTLLQHLAHITIKLFENELQVRENSTFPLYEFQVASYLQSERSMAYTVCHAPLNCK